MATVDPILVTAVAGVGGVMVTLFSTRLRGRTDAAQQIIDGQETLTEHWQAVAQDTQARLGRAEEAIAAAVVRANDADRRAFDASERAHRAEQHAITCDASLAALQIAHTALVQRVSHLEG